MLEYKQYRAAVQADSCVIMEALIGNYKPSLHALLLSSLNLPSSSSTSAFALLLPFPSSASSLQMWVLTAWVVPCLLSRATTRMTLTCLPRLGAALWLNSAKSRSLFFIVRVSAVSQVFFILSAGFIGFFHLRHFENLLCLDVLSLLV